MGLKCKSPARHDGGRACGGLPPEQLLAQSGLSNHGLQRAYGDFIGQLAGNRDHSNFAAHDPPQLPMAGSVVSLDDETIR